MGALELASLRGWAPIHISAAAGEPRVRWALIDAAYVEPFFEQTAERALTHPFNLAFARYTPLSTLDAFGDVAAAAPAGFVFHMSRCGSTLIAQMLSRLHGAIVLSEPSPLDALLRLRGRIGSDEVFSRRMRGLLNALARQQSGERVFVKFHAWHVLELPAIARAFPGVPWVFVFRNPDQVLRSQALLPGAEYVAGTIDPALVGVRSAEEFAAPDYGARVIGALCEAAVRNASLGRSAFVDYADLPGAIGEILDFFGVPRRAEENAAMLETARRDTKRDGEAFVPRAGADAGDAAIREAAARWIDGPYRALRASCQGPRV